MSLRFNKWHGVFLRKYIFERTFLNIFQYIRERYVFEIFIKINFFQMLFV